MTPFAGIPKLAVTFRVKFAWHFLLILLILFVLLLLCTFLRMRRRRTGRRLLRIVVSIPAILLVASALLKSKARSLCLRLRVGSGKCGFLLLSLSLLLLLSFGLLLLSEFLFTLFVSFGVFSLLLFHLNLVINKVLG